MLMGSHLHVSSINHFPCVSEVLLSLFTDANNTRWTGGSYLHRSSWSAVACLHTNTDSSLMSDSTSCAQLNERDMRARALYRRRSNCASSLQYNELKRPFSECFSHILSSRLFNNWFSMHPCRKKKEKKRVF